jgi:NADPH-dependent 2,4-dienoyl-CoA reductase/sulfur reductase-like enzyme
MKRLSLIMMILGSLTACSGSGNDRHTYDLVIYGNTSAGIMAGIQARRDGLDVIVIGPDRHIGGLTAGGLGWTDSGNKEAIGGLSREFYRRVKAHYDRP